MVPGRYGGSGDAAATERRGHHVAFGFFTGRIPLEIEDSPDADGRTYHEYVNVPRAIGAVISAGRASLRELDTVYGVADLYLLLEIVMIDAANQRIANAPST